MKKILIAMSLLVLAALPPAVSAAQKQGNGKADSAKFLQKLVSEKIKSAGQERSEDAAMRLNSGETELRKQFAAVISDGELAASGCRDLVRLGLQNDRETFAAEFTVRLRKYIPELHNVMGRR